jgi:two-component system, OmpR family, alkaline phosphatase synthesis response regulator PhoP
MNRKILIVEDDRPIAELLSYILQREGFEVGIALTGTDGLEQIKDNEPALILLDWNLPDISGIQLCRQITQSSKIPIIMLTAKNLIEDKIQGLEMGADDYITKPFDVREVVARIKATFRRLSTRPDPAGIIEKTVIEIAGLKIDAGSMTVTVDGQPVDLTPLEYSLLIYLYKNKNLVLTRDQILDAVWGYEFSGNTRTVDIHVLRLRQKLNLSDQIQTVYKVGYKFVL